MKRPIGHLYAYFLAFSPDQTSINIFFATLDVAAVVAAEVVPTSPSGVGTGACWVNSMTYCNAGDSEYSAGSALGRC